MFGKVLNMSKNETWITRLIDEDPKLLITVDRAQGFIFVIDLINAEGVRFALKYIFLSKKDTDDLYVKSILRSTSFELKKVIAEILSFNDTFSLHLQELKNHG